MTASSSHNSLTGRVAAVTGESGGIGAATELQSHVTDEGAKAWLAMAKKTMSG